MARAARTAFGLPSRANGTPASEGRDPRTNVISGWPDATVAPRSRSTPSSSLVRAPLECNATLFFQSAAPAMALAASAIAPSGTQNQTIPALITTCAGTAATAPTSLASLRARRKDAADPLDTICSITYPASRNDTARAPARFPAPTIAMRGFADRFTGMPGRIAESAFDPASVKSVVPRPRTTTLRVFSMMPCFILFACPSLLAPNRSL
jgi:hypothetical protein